MKKQILVLALLAVASTAFAAQATTSGPEPNLNAKVFAFTKASDASGITVIADNASKLQPAIAITAGQESAAPKMLSDRRPRPTPAVAVFAPKPLNGGGSGGITLLQANARELHPRDPIKKI